MPQFFNWPAIRLFWRAVIWHRDWCVPKWTADGVGGVPWQQLHASGVRAVLFDKDQTLTWPHVSSFGTDDAREAVSNCQKVFGNHRVAVLSNSAGSSDDVGRRWALARDCEQALGLAVVRHGTKKPDPALVPSIVAHFNDDLLTASQIALVGDRVLTDTVFANANQLVSVLVPPLFPDADNQLIRLLRYFELKLL